MDVEGANGAADNMGSSLQVRMETAALHSLGCVHFPGSHDSWRKETAWFLALEISKFIRRQVRTGLKGCRTGMDKDEIFEAAWLVQECNNPSNI
jgi:hypothetical protein